MRQQPKTDIYYPSELRDERSKRLFASVVYYEISQAYRDNNTLGFLDPDDLQAILSYLTSHQLAQRYLTFLQLPFLITTVASRWAHARCIDPDFETGLLLADAGIYFILATYSAPRTGCELTPKFLALVDKLASRLV